MRQLRITNNNFFPVLLLAVVISSCTKPKSKLSPYGPVFENVMRSDSGVFRGFSLGDQPGFVLSKEQGKPIESDSAYLYYEYPLDSVGSFNITYNFDDFGLSEIQSDIYITNPDKADEVFSKFKAFFDDHYGKSESRMGFSVWSVKSEKYREVQINLSDESTDFTAAAAPGKISLWIYPEKD